MGNGALAERVRSGDRAAFAEMYGEFADRIFGFCVVLLRDREEAADATHDTFVLAAQRAEQLRDPERLLAWLFAIARHVCYRRLEKRKRELPVEVDVDLVAAEEADLERGLSAEDARALVWAAAQGLSDRDRAVLALNTREGLEGAELAAALGVQQANPYSLLNRAKAQLQTAVTTLLVARFGRGDCSTLAGMLEDWDGTLTPLLRKRLGRHLVGCASCRRTKGRVVPMSAVALAPALRPDRADALDRVDTDHLLEIASRRPLDDEQWLPDGFPPPVDADERRRRRKMFFLIAAAAGVFIVGALGVVAAGGASPDRPRSRETADEQPVVAPEPGRTSTTLPAGTTTSSVVPVEPGSVTTLAPPPDAPVSPPGGAVEPQAPTPTSPPATNAPTTTVKKSSPPSSSPPPPTIPTTTTTTTFRT